MNTAAVKVRIPIDTLVEVIPYQNEKIAIILLPRIILLYARSMIRSDAFKHIARRSDIEDSKINRRWGVEQLEHSGVIELNSDITIQTLLSEALTDPQSNSEVLQTLEEYSRLPKRSAEYNRLQRRFCEVIYDIFYIGNCWLPIYDVSDRCYHIDCQLDKEEVVYSISLTP